MLLQAAAFNLALILRSITKAGTPRGLADLKQKLLCAFVRVLDALDDLDALVDRSGQDSTLHSVTSRPPRPLPQKSHRRRKLAF